MKRNILILTFSIYSYLINILFILLEALPPVLRQIVFKLSLKDLGEGSFIDYKTFFRYPSKISLGKYVTVNRGCEFFASYLVPGGTIKIGNNVILSPYVKMYTIGHNPKTKRFDDLAGPIVIEDNVWIGADSIILPNVTVGEGAVIGAGSVVTRDIPSKCIAVGIPAKVIKKISKGI